MKDVQSRRERRAALLATITPEEERRITPVPRIVYSFVDMDELVAECKISIAEMCLENPQVNPDDVAHDIVMSYQMQLAGSRRREFRERNGFYL